MSAGSEPARNDLASAVWTAHGLVMNGGVLHAVESLKPAELDRAISGYERLGLGQAAGLLSSARKLADSEKDAAEARLDREYAAAVPDDAFLEATIERFDPPPKPKIAIKDQTDEALIETYRSAASAHGRASASGDSRGANRAHDVLASAYRTLRARGPDSQAKLLQLIRDPDVGVRTWVAAHALEFSAETGEPVLIDLAAQPGLVGFNAKMTLREWRAGRLRFP